MNTRTIFRRLAERLRLVASVGDHPVHGSEVPELPYIAGSPRIVKQAEQLFASPPGLYEGPAGGGCEPQPVGADGPLYRYACETPDYFEQAWSQAIRDIQVLHDKKRNDYTGGNVDQLVNYRRAAEVIDIPVENGMLMRIQEKVTRLGNLFTGTKQQVSDESTIDSLRDVAVISLLIIAELQARKNDNYGY